MEPSSLLTYVLPAVAGGAVTFVGTKLPQVRRKVWAALVRLSRALNYARRFVFASRRTRRHARASFVSRRDGLSLPVLEFTLLRWYDKHPDLIEYVRHVRLNNRSENVKREVAKLLWDIKEAWQLQVNDIVLNAGGSHGHVLWVDTSDERVFALLEASANSARWYEPPRTREVMVVRGSWCPIDDCQYCELTENQIRTLGALWHNANEAERKANRLEYHARRQRVREPSDVEEILEGLSDSEQIARTGEGDSGHDLPASTIGELRALAEVGWTFDVTRIVEHRYFSGVLVSEWAQPVDVA